MIVKLTLENFLAHASSVFEFAPGLNVLTGPNNSGKSAVVEALRCLAENPIPKHVIRHGAKEARVTAELADGARVTWIRTPKYALYELTRPGATEPETYAKFGRTPPEDILAALKLDRVPLEGSDASIDVHLGNQREPVFLLNEPGSVMASFFASSTESAHLIAMQNLLSDKTRKAKREKARLDASLEAASRDLDRLARLPDLELALETGRALEDALGVLDRDIPALESVLAARRALVRRLSALAAKTAALQTLSPPPPPFDVAGLARTLFARAALAASRNHAVAKATALRSLAAPPVPAETAGLVRLTADMARVRSAQSHIQTRSRALADLAAPPETFPVANLAGHLATRRALAAKLARSGAVRAVHDRLAPPPEPRDTAPLAELTARIRILRAQRAAAADSLAQHASRLAALHEAIENRLRDVGLCPLCGGELHSETFLDQTRRAS